MTIGSRGTNPESDLSVDNLRARIKLIGGGDATEHENRHTVAASVDATTMLTFQRDDTSTFATGSRAASRNCGVSLKP
jgi:hypothetical protein